jgi:hypothetical protein
MILGEFILENIDIEKIMANQQSLNSADTQDTIKLILLHLLRCYSLARNKTSLEQIEALLLKYFAQDALARQYLDYYRL